MKMRKEVFAVGVVALVLSANAVQATVSKYREWIGRTSG